MDFKNWDDKDADVLSDESLGTAQIAPTLLEELVADAARRASGSEPRPRELKLLRNT